MAIILELLLFQCSRLNVFSKLHSTDAPKQFTEWNTVSFLSLTLAVLKLNCVCLFVFL